MMKRIAILCTLILALGGVANATIYWVGGASGNWSVPTNWNTQQGGGGTSGLPGAGDEADINTNSTVTLDTNANIKLFFIAKGTATAGTLVMNQGYKLEVNNSGGAGQSVGIGNSGVGVVQLASGAFVVDSGDLRVNASAPGTAGSTINMTGGSLNAYNIRKNNSTSLGPGMTGSSGTVVLNQGGGSPGSLYRFGGTASTDNSGQDWEIPCLVAPGDVGTVGVFNIGQTGYEQKSHTDATAIIQIDLAGDASYDVVHSSGNVDASLGTLDLKALDSYVPAIGQTFDVWKIDLKTGKKGVGTFDPITDNLPGYFVADGNDLNGNPIGWIDTDADPSAYGDTLRVMYLPEPATLALLAMGGTALLIRRKRS